MVAAGATLINKPRPSPAGTDTCGDLALLLQALAERVADRRASSMLRALNAEAATFPRLHSRYCEEIVAPRREAMNRVLRRGVQRGEIRPDADPDLISDLLVSPPAPRPHGIGQYRPAGPGTGEPADRRPRPRRCGARAELTEDERTGTRSRHAVTAPKAQPVTSPVRQHPHRIPGAVLVDTSLPDFHSDSETAGSCPRTPTASSSWRRAQAGSGRCPMTRSPMSADARTASNP